ncbi:hypothetical protein [Shinella sp. DD12]|uniref:hypothetical protein n=1 Tax=Shinella sp. DD12 TaxID=1410620 RepID=UPI0003C56978|nr:hypothetical protein [Shinella sp. DD12]EYR80001.1 hypothetical protein SHLA_1c001810 [Shinella sp. DD12]
MTAYAPFVVPDPTGSIRKAKASFKLSLRRVAFITGQLPRRNGGTLDERADLMRALADTLQEAADAAEILATATENFITRGADHGTNH